MDKKPPLDITRDYVPVLDKALEAVKMYSVSVFKSKIWPDLHLGSEVPIPQFLQSFTCAEVAFLGLGTILLLGGWRLQVAI